MNPGRRGVIVLYDCVIYEDLSVQHHFSKVMKYQSCVWAIMCVRNGQKAARGGDKVRWKGACVMDGTSTISVNEFYNDAKHELQWWCIRRSTFTRAPVGYVAQLHTQFSYTAMSSHSMIFLESGCCRIWSSEKSLMYSIGSLYNSSGV